MLNFLRGVLSKLFDCRVQGMKTFNFLTWFANIRVAEKNVQNSSDLILAVDLHCIMSDDKV